MRRRVGVLVAVAVLGAALASAASAARGTRAVVDFTRAPLGPKSAFVGFRSHGLMLAARARRVGVVHWKGSRALVVAPVKGGGFCKSLEGPYGGAQCYLRPPRLDPGYTGDGSGPVVLDGVFTDPRGVRLRVTYQDGARTDIPIMWVGAPIKAGLFVFPIPRPHRAVHHRPRTLTLYSAGGSRLVSRSLLP
ncbi:MAG TPA: hypothetical protein VGH82_07575 [Gaiellaceae bacterium]|jgi:hypothetical protein